MSHRQRFMRRPRALLLFTEMPFRNGGIIFLFASLCCLTIVNCHLPRRLARPRARSETLEINEHSSLKSGGTNAIVFGGVESSWLSISWHNTGRSSSPPVDAARSSTRGPSAGGARTRRTNLLQNLLRTIFVVPISLTTKVKHSSVDPFPVRPLAPLTGDA